MQSRSYNCQFLEQKCAHTNILKLNQIQLRVVINKHHNDTTTTRNHKTVMISGVLYKLAISTHTLRHNHNNITGNNLKQSSCIASPPTHGKRHDSRVCEWVCYYVCAGLCVCVRELVCICVYELRHVPIVHISRLMDKHWRTQ